MRDMSYVQQELSKESDSKRAVLQRTMQLLFGGLPKDRLTQDLVNAVDYLNSQSFVRHGKIGSVGFCFGGGMSINLACHAQTAACVIFYGENPSPIELVEKIKCPVLGIYGGEDERINATLDRLVAAMTRYKKDFEMRVYPGAPHAFFNDTNPTTYREQAAKEAWDRVLRFYARTLQID
jgi:carboxymethylenebutenolidase